MKIYTPNYNEREKRKHYYEDRFRNLLSFFPNRKHKKFKVIYYYHVPKCGGNYTISFMKLIQKKLRCEFISFTLLNNQPKPLDSAEKQIQFIQSIKKYSKRDVLMLHHHHGYPGIEDIHDDLLQAKKDVAARGGEMFIFTIIREPVEHLISFVNYLRKWPETTMTFKQRIEHPSSVDVMTRYFLYNEANRWLTLAHKGHVDGALLKKNIQLFDKIYLTENINLMTRDLNNFLETDVVLDKKINVSKKEVMPTNAELDQFLKGIHWDKQFYNLVKNHGPDVQKMTAVESFLTVSDSTKSK